jgi:hypothetical protein
VTEGPTKAATGAVKRALKREYETDAGRINGGGTALLFLLIVLLGAPAVLEATLSHLLPGAEPHEFPWVPVVAIFVGGTLICVVVLAVLQPFLGEAEPTGGRKDGSGTKP